MNSRVSSKLFRSCLLLVIFTVCYQASAITFITGTFRSKVEPAILSISYTDSPDDATINVVTVKLWGIEISDYNKHVNSFMLSHITNQTLSVVVADWNDSGFVTGIVYTAENKDISELLVQNGFAFPYNDNDRYLQAQRYARKNISGMWSNIWVDSTAPAEEEKPSRSPATQSSIGKFYKVRVNAGDTRTIYDSSTNSFLIEQQIDKNGTLRRFILVTDNPRRIIKLKDDQNVTLYVELTSYSTVNGVSRTSMLPVLKEVGKSRFLGVGGDVLFFK